MNEPTGEGPKHDGEPQGVYETGEYVSKRQAGLLDMIVQYAQACGYDVKIVNNTDEEDSARDLLKVNLRGTSDDVEYVLTLLHRMGAIINNDLQAEQGRRRNAETVAVVKEKALDTARGAAGAAARWLEKRAAGKKTD